MGDVKSTSTRISMIQARQDAYGKVEHIRIANALEDTQTFSAAVGRMEPKLAMYFKGGRNMIIDINAIFCGVTTQGSFSDQTSKKTIRLAKALSNLFGELSSQFKKQLDKIAEVKTRLPAIHDKLEKKFLFGVLRAWAQNIIPYIPITSPSAPY
jgi:hypothetical protein